MVREKQIGIFAQPAFTCSKLAIVTREQRCEICSKLTIKTPKRRQWRRFSVFIVNFEHISHLCSSVSIVNFEHVIASWVGCQWIWSERARVIVSNSWSDNIFLLKAGNLVFRVHPQILFDVLNFHFKHIFPNFLSPEGRQIRKFFSGKLSGILQKPKCHLCEVCF